MGAPMLLDDEVVGALVLWRNEVNPFDDREMAIVTAFAGQAAMAVNGVKLVQAAGGTRRRARQEGRGARGVARGRRGGELEPGRRPRARPPSPCTPSSSPGPTAARSWSTPSATAASWSGASTGPSPTVVGTAAVDPDRPRRDPGRPRRTERRPIAVADLGAVRPRPAPADPPRRRLAVPGRRADAARGPDRRVVWSCGASGPATSPRRPSTCSRRSPASRHSPC